MIKSQFFLSVILKEKNLSPKNTQKKCQTIDRSMPQKSRLLLSQKVSYLIEKLVKVSKDLNSGGVHTDP